MTPATPASDDGRLVPPPSGVALRLYRQGLGDAFLLAFPRSDRTGRPEPYYVLIDCGVILRTSQPRLPMTAVAEDVARATGGRIDLLVITHEHWDHISGFLQAEEVWKEVHIEAVWMAWTEDMSIPLARRLKQEFHNDLDAVRLALDRAGQDAVHAAALTGLLGFFGDPVAFLAAAKQGHRFSEMTRDALNKVRELAGNRVDYPEPGNVFFLPGVPGVRVYVLGPPKNEKALRSIRPSKRRPPTYSHKDRPPVVTRPGPRPSEKTAFTLALKCGTPAGMTTLPMTDAEKEVYQQCFPFDGPLRVPLAEAAAIPFFRENYGFPDAPPPTPAAPPPGPAVVPPLVPGPAWRRLGDTVPYPLLAAARPVSGKGKGGKKTAKGARKKASPGTPDAIKKPQPEPKREVAPLPPPESYFPFDRHLRIDLKSEAARYPFFWEHYGFDDASPPAPPTPPPAPVSRPVVDGPEWRRVDQDWLGVAGELALQMDNYTNNTSLALAIELVGTGKVLLFPADAQVGNWLSWDEIAPPFTGADGRPVTAANLIRRTVFYKVGHHGSHNATMRDAGLERMDRPDLFAYVPVDERVAREVKRWKDMPFEPLLARLYEKTRGRVIRLDHGVVTDQRPEFVPPELWERIAPSARSFRDSCVRPGGSLPRADGGAEQPLYYQVVIEDTPDDAANVGTRRPYISTTT